MSISQADFARYDGLGLAELVRNRQATAEELLEAAIARADLVNPKLNAIVSRIDQRALENCAHVVDGPFSGVPFLVKDLLQDLAGVPTTNGSKCLVNSVAECNSSAVQHWLDAGLVIFGKTNACEFGLKTVTESDLFGPTHNPWNLAKTPGGSSGGAAAAVASGIVPLAGGNDGGGSLRIPAAACGLFSLIPGHPLNDDQDKRVRPIASLIEHGVITRSVRDAAAMLGVMQGNSSLDNQNRYLQLLSSPPSPLRIGYCATSPLGTPVDAEARNAVNDAAHLLTSLGHHVEEAHPTFDGRALAHDFLLAWFCSIHEYVTKLRNQNSNAQLQVEFNTRLIAALGADVSADELVDSINRRAGYTLAFKRFYETYDFWLTPTISAAAPPIGQLETPALVRIASELYMKLGLIKYLRKSDQFERTVLNNLSWTPYTQIANYLGLPAMSVPLYWTSTEMPLGVQFVGPRGVETKLLGLAAQLEQARPWFYRIPKI